MKLSKAVEILKESFLKHMHCDPDCCIDDYTMYSRILMDLEFAGIRPPPYELAKDTFMSVEYEPEDEPEISDSNSLVLKEENWDKFTAALETPPPYNKDLTKALAKYNNNKIKPTPLTPEELKDVIENDEDLYACEYCEGSGKGSNGIDFCRMCDGLGIKVEEDND